MVFVILGLLGTISPEEFISSRYRNPELIRIVSVISILFFGMGTIFIARKLFDNSPGLTIDQNGITNNTNATNLGLIEWGDITGIGTIQLKSTKFLILYVKKPEKYIDRTKNVIMKQAMIANNKIYGSPITITANSLRIDFNNLERLIKSEFDRRKK